MRQTRRVWAASSQTIALIQQFIWLLVPNCWKSAEPCTAFQLALPNSPAHTDCPQNSSFTSLDPRFKRTPTHWCRTSCLTLQNKEITKCWHTTLQSKKITKC